MVSAVMEELGVTSRSAIRRRFERSKPVAKTTIVETRHCSWSC